MTKYRISLEWYKGRHRYANELFEFKAEDDFAADKMFVDFVRNVMKGLVSVWSWDEISELGREKPTFELCKKFPDGEEQTINFLEYGKLAAIYKGNAMRLQEVTNEKQLHALADEASLAALAEINENHLKTL